MGVCRIEETTGIVVAELKRIVVPFADGCYDLGGLYQEHRHMQSEDI